MRKISSINTQDEFNQEVSQNKNVLRAIRLKCYDCSAYQINEVNNCNITTCPLFPFRSGKNPFLRREMTDEEKKEIRDRLRKNKTN